MMKKFSKKNLVVFLIIVFFLSLTSPLLAQRELEVKYPEISGFRPKSVKTLLPEYVRYIFNFFIAIGGLIGFAVLIWAGFRYLTSIGKPEELQKAREQIKSAIFGILLLFFSWLILTTINPQLAFFEIKIPPGPTAPPLKIPISPGPVVEILVRISELAQATKEVADQITNTAREIKSLTNNCNCARTQPFCLVEGYMAGACEAQFCYSASEDQPCPDIKKVRENQQKLVDLRDIILYYKNRALAEDEDLKEDLEKVVNKKLKWFEDKIAAEKKVLKQCQTTSCQEFQKKLIEALEKDKKILEKEENYKRWLRVKLDELAQAIKRIEEPTTNLALLPDQCQTNVREKCQGSCQGGGHDTLGCFPAACNGGNPCPDEEIQKRLEEISSLSVEIRQIAEEIIRISELIPELPKPPPPPVPESCTAVGGICVAQEETCPKNYSPSDKFPCPEEKRCCLPLEKAVCYCDNPSPSDCANLADYGIAYKDGPYIDKKMAEKLVIFKDCLEKNNVKGWQVTEACPPVIQHRSRCHHFTGTCVDADSAVLCQNPSITSWCIRVAGFSSYINECGPRAPHFHIIY